MRQWPECVVTMHQEKGKNVRVHLRAMFTLLQIRVWANWHLETNAES